MLLALNVEKQATMLINAPTVKITKIHQNQINLKQIKFVYAWCKRYADGGFSSPMDLIYLKVGYFGYSSNY
jgi:hypothetical protein